MKTLKTTTFHIIFFVFILTYTTINAQNAIIKHDLQTEIQPDKSFIFVKDRIDLSASEGNKMYFYLNSSLIPFSNSDNINLTKLENDNNAADIGMDRDIENAELDLTKWEILFLTDAKECTISYKGKIQSSLEQSNDNYQRGFSESPGIISAKGIYLAGSTYWIPTFPKLLYTFALQSNLPKDWKSVSQGKRTESLDSLNSHFDQWVCEKPQEEIFLIGAKFNEYSFKMNNGVEAMTFLRSPDENLANKYLEVTEQYMTMYEGLISKYPYSKFALVENFWETGYGMPSFTLLGEKIIRFPFILHSSYPHELLHNWWGNSVYVNFDRGNWCEGLTAYMADHLIKEQRGQGNSYRRSTLQKFTDFVSPDNDFPLSKFINRHDGSSEAIGYGKSLMMFHMLRLKLGDKKFIEGLKLFYKNNNFKLASFSNIRAAMEKVSGINLKKFFNQWVKRKGAPKLSLLTVDLVTKNNKKKLLVMLQQKSTGKPYVLDIPIYIKTEKGVTKEIFKMNKNKQGHYFEIGENIKEVVVDPFYDVFRLLDPKEVPPALSKIWASKKNIIILPKKASDDKSKIYADFAQKWIENDKDDFKIVFDSDIKTLPKEETAWIIGFENKFASIFNKQIKEYGSSIKNDIITLGEKDINIKGKDFAITTFEPGNYNKQIVFMSIGNKKSVPGFVRKLPHYGKYSFLAFDGDEPTNIAKGQWPVLNSPLSHKFGNEPTNALKDDRIALAYLAPVFSKDRMLSHINFLASKDLKGRGLGTAELDKAADYIARLFKNYGLKPIDDSYFQEFKYKFKDKGKLKLKNVIGIIPGTDPELKESPVVLSAHYDHLGLGWPDVHSGDEGKIHFGADDNASGVAILLEIAKSLGKSFKPKRTIIFAAFTGEEAGLIGSRHFVNNFKSDFTHSPFADVNLDTDGRLFDKKIMVLNGNTAREWKFIFMGTDYTTGVKSTVVEKELDSSDQFAFIEKGIPAVQLFTGAHQDYHRPTDTADKIDGEGLVKICKVTKEVVEYLADRADPMPFTGKTGKTQNNNETSNKLKKVRRAATGSIPDFAYKGKGVRISSVISGSAGDKAGLKEGDVITSINGVVTDDLKKYSDELKKYKPDDVVTLKVLRNSTKITIEIKLGAR